MTRQKGRWASVARRAVLAAAPLLCVVVLTGGVDANQAWSLTPAGSAAAAGGIGPGSHTGPGSGTGAAPGAGPSTEPGTGGTAAGDGSTASAVPPTRVRIPAIRVDAPLDRLSLDAAGALQPPTDFAHAGWYADGTVPGEIGPAVIAGHVDNRSGPAVFFRLYQLKAGDVIQVQRAGRWIEFTVASTARYPKNQFPTARVYGPTPDVELRLITCGGLFNPRAHSYVDNVVVYAVAVVQPGDDTEYTLGGGPTA